MKPCFLGHGFPAGLDRLIDNSDSIALFSGPVPTDFSQLSFDPENPDEVWDNCIGVMFLNNVSTISNPKLNIIRTSGTDLLRLFKGCWFLTDTSKVGQDGLTPLPFNKYISCLPRGVRFPKKYPNEGVSEWEKYQSAARLASVANPASYSEAAVMTVIGDYFEVDLDTSNLCAGLILGWHYNNGSSRYHRVFAVTADGTETELWYGKPNTANDPIVKYIGTLSGVHQYWYDFDGLIDSSHVKLKFVSTQPYNYQAHSMFYITNDPVGPSYDPVNDVSATSVGTATWGLMVDQGLANPFGLIDIGGESAGGPEQFLVTQNTYDLCDTLADGEVPAMGTPKFSTYNTHTIEYGGGS